LATGIVSTKLVVHELLRWYGHAIRSGGRGDHDLDSKEGRCKLRLGTSPHRRCSRRDPRIPDGVKLSEIAYVREPDLPLQSLALVRA
jgi:hypothetical protein